MKMSKKHWWNDTDKGKQKHSEDNPVPVPLCPQQISHRLARDQTRTSAVTGEKRIPRIQRLNVCLIKLPPLEGPVV